MYFYFCVPCVNIAPLRLRKQGNQNLQKFSHYDKKDSNSFFQFSLFYLILVYEIYILKFPLTSNVKT